MIWILQDQHYICTILHPSLKNFEIAPTEKNKALKLIKQELLARKLNYDSAIDRTSTTASDPASNTTNDASSKPDDLLAYCFDKLKPGIQPVQTPLKELDEYMISTATISETDNILLFWKQQEEKYPTLSMIVRELYAIPAANTIVERLFSASKNIMTDKRTSLGEEKLNQLLFLKKNLHVLKEIQKKQFTTDNEQFKKRTLVSDGEPICINEETNDSILSLTMQIDNKIDDEDYNQDSYDMNDTINSIETDNIFLNL